MAEDLDIGLNLHTLVVVYAQITVQRRAPMPAWIECDSPKHQPTQRPREGPTTMQHISSSLPPITPKHFSAPRAQRRAEKSRRPAHWQRPSIRRWKDTYRAAAAHTTAAPKENATADESTRDLQTHSAG